MANRDRFRPIYGDGDKRFRWPNADAKLEPEEPIERPAPVRPMRFKRLYETEPALPSNAGASSRPQRPARNRYVWSGIPVYSYGSDGCGEVDTMPESENSDGIFGFGIIPALKKRILGD